jgi:hypothetical protein
VKKVIVTSGWGAGYPEGGGPSWLVLHYLAGLRALGIEGFWLDMLGPAKPGSKTSAESLIENFAHKCARFGFDENWAVLYDRKQVFGMNERTLLALCGDCDLLINLCGALQADDLLQRIKRRAFFDLDPGFTQAWAHHFDLGLAKHNLFFTVGQNVGGKDFPIPIGDISWQPFLPPVALEFWLIQTASPARPFTTVGQWRGQEALWNGEYYGPKREELLRFIELPGKTTQPVELALLIHESETDDLAKLRANGWRLVDPHVEAAGLDGFRNYIQQSRAEFSVAKSGYIKSHSGWFSDRTVCYLASGRPALVQDTGIGLALPVGKGLLTFRTMEEAAAGFDAINSDYDAHCGAARRIAEEKLTAPIVLQSILETARVL